MRLRSCLFALTTALALHARIDASPLIFTDRATFEAFGNRTCVFRSIRLRPPPMGPLYTCRNNLPHFSRWHAGGLVAVHTAFVWSRCHFRAMRSTAAAATRVQKFVRPHPWVQRVGDLRMGLAGASVG
jgi:hypothetical protein